MTVSPALTVLLSILPFGSSHSNSNSTHGPVVDLPGPPMGFMSWERFRCQVDCRAFPHDCIDEALYLDMAKALVLGGYANAGYVGVHMDDCWSDGRDGAAGKNRLRANATRFPHGIAWLADVLHAQGLKLGIYADAGVETCGGYAGSQGYQEIDAQTFADWGVDYLKLDGCHIRSGDDDDDDRNHKYDKVYTSFGRALRDVASTRPMVFSCSWPAYIGANESTKPFGDMYHRAGCNTWRNYRDVDNQWTSLRQIILHWADYWQVLQSIPDGAFNDADMLLVGDDHYGHVLSTDQAKLQMGFWAMIASPLFIGGDVRKITPEYQAILLNEHVIAINQDPSRKQADCVRGCRETGSLPIQVWSKRLDHDKSRALAFINLQDNTTKASIDYNYTAEGLIARCVDLWSNDTEKDVCAGGQGDTTDEWATRVINQVVLQIAARRVAPTSHRLLRIDYLCDQETNCSSGSSSVS